MKCFKILPMALVASLVVSASAIPVSAAEDSNPPVPSIAKELAKEEGFDVVVQEPGVYSVGDSIVIDMEVFQGEENGIMPYGMKPPAKNDVWNWSNGSYSATFDIKRRIFTDKRFTGYDTYHVSVSVKESEHINNGIFTVTAIQDNNNEGASYISNSNWASIYFTNCKPYEKLAFAVSVPADGVEVHGDITVSNE